MVDKCQKNDEVLWHLLASLENRKMLSGKKKALEFLKLGLSDGVIILLYFVKTPDSDEGFFGEENTTRNLVERRKCGDVGG